MPYVQLDDARLYYDTEGDRGSPVVLIMGFGVPGAMWRNQVAALSRAHRVTWFDNCGAGSSRSHRRLPYTTRDLARHVAGLMDALGWPDAHVAGVSMGGMIAQEVALRHRQRVRSLALLVTHAGGVRNLIPNPRGLALFARGFLGPRSRRVEAMQRLIYPDAYLAAADRDRIGQALRDHVVGAASTRERLGQIAAVMSHRTGRRLRALEGLPTVVFKANEDVLLRPSACHRLHELIPGSKLVELEDAGHAVLHQCADRVNRELLAHFGAADAIRA
jgi:pimeloyl-ACP methyl ester carboxylesterase